MKKIIFTFLICFSLLNASPVVVSAQVDANYQMLAPIPGITGSDGKTTDLNTFLPGFIRLMIGLSGALAVLMIIKGGIQYMSTDAVSGKQDGKATIQNAILGLLLVIGAYSILYTVNPRLVNIDLSIKGLAVGGAFKNGLGTSLDGKVGEIPDPDKIGETNTDKNKYTGGTGCSKCVAVSQTIDQKPAGPGCSGETCKGKGCSAAVCVVDPTLAAKLITLNQHLKERGISWQITEMFPPTANHVDSCHNAGPDAGKCVDVALRSQGAANIIMFILLIEKDVGPSFQWEVVNDTSQKGLQDSLEKYIKEHRTEFFSKDASFIGATDIQKLVDKVRSKIVVNSCTKEKTSCATAEHVHIKL